MLQTCKRQESEAHCFCRHDRIKVIKTSKSARVVCFKVLNDGFLNDADGVVGLPVCKRWKWQGNLYNRA